MFTLINTTKDEMTPLERAKALASGNAIDRIQCNPNLSCGIARVDGRRISEFNVDPKALAGSAVATYRRFGLDSAKVFTDLFILSEAMGATVKFPDDDTPDLLRPAITDITQIETLRPVDPYKDGRLPVHLEAMEILYDAIGSEVPCSSLVVGPFTSAFFLIGVEKLVKLMIHDPETVHKLCEISLQSCMNFADAIVAKGLTPGIAEPMSSCTVVSPKHFREFAKPYIARFVAHIKSKGRPVSIHICGKTDAIFQDLADIGIDFFSIDNVVDLKKCVNEVGHRMKIGGNVDPSTIMYLGKPSEVRKKTLECIQSGFESPKGFMVMPGCGLPVETPLVNIDAMMDTAREVGWPITHEKIERLLSR